MADATLLFSSSIAEQLKSISTGLVVVPGGGVRADEHGDPLAERNFRKVHESSKPYFLVLGRKTASKGYEQTLRSHQALREAGIDIELVMIGPDEDGRAVKGAGVHYLGRQPRDVIRGALRSCLAVVNMSRSESFGIVLCEAWLFGKPVIANRVCYSFRELVRDGETGFLVTTDTELTEAMKSLASDVDARGRMGRAGFQDVVTNFTWERVAESCFDALMPNHFPRERLKSTVQVAGADRPSGA
jgi:glycosyltransferase involved in cell wall biosynthesis